ncbi:DUF6880 family protein [Sulfitobacter donghicola]|uniref:Uncharacterized protein n=1 Tax=Sulfitobacter donghicola DSW-25 = KCTC 12864 = JCM 14565 TaxID=1300350 RepID=A0A073IUM1_9RHOB|nr:DUF6880 family protein [Sulfitobacter donghicola]KEJ89067.1 hypothetical protein DSW25_12645 [Sulfitobacter donghicola DSW-25 = KCTC 12864 = JCM 14565]KIN67359.1 hypothetical protein Z948_1072 [Sulfitobacter donghicola DSW-25 = KCTC 12864 = JCM 14565]
MSKKTLNEANLSALGAERLAQLLIEVSTGSAEIKRRLRLELSHNLGATELAHDVRKRLTSIQRSKSRVSWRKRKALVKDLSTQAEMITDKIALEAPTEAFDLLWQFTQMAPSVFDRVDDSRGEVQAVFSQAFEQFGEIADRAILNPTDLATRTWDALRDNSCGEFDGIIPLLAPSMGDEGLAHLKELIAEYKETPLETNDDDHAALQFLRDLRSTGGDFAAEQKNALIRDCLQEIAIAQGDTDAYIDQYSQEDLADPAVAAEVALLLLENDQPEKAFDLLMDADPQDAGVQPEWDAAYIACLLYLGRVDDAQTHRWDCFRRTLAPDYLRDHLKLLPDFDDIEAEDTAKALAMEFGDLTTALLFFTQWPDLSKGAQLIETRTAEIDGQLDHILGPIAETLQVRYPMAAVLLWRRMIDYALWEGRTQHYAQMAGYLMDCAAVDGEIEDYGKYPTHLSYLENLRQTYPHKASFWAKLP